MTSTQPEPTANAWIRWAPEALARVQRERREAYRKFGDASMGGAIMTRSERLAVIAEEFGEVAREVVTSLRNASGIDPLRHGEFDIDALIGELAQTAACALMWIEAEMRFSFDSRARDPESYAERSRAADAGEPDPDQKVVEVGR